MEDTGRGRGGGRSEGLEQRKEERSVIKLQSQTGA